MRRDELGAFTLRLAGDIAANAHTAGQVKRLYSRASELSLADALDFERSASAPGGGTGRPS